MRPASKYYNGLKGQLHLAQGNTLGVWIPHHHTGALTGQLHNSNTETLTENVVALTQGANLLCALYPGLFLLWQASPSSPSDPGLSVATLSPTYFWGPLLRNSIKKHAENPCIPPSNVLSLQDMQEQHHSGYSIDLQPFTSRLHPMSLALAFSAISL